LTTSSAVSYIRHEVRTIMWQYVSLCRDQEGLLEAQRRISELQQSLSTLDREDNGNTASLLQWAETSNMLLVARLVIAAALQRCESRGSHWRRDYPTSDETLAGYHYRFVRANPTTTLATSQQEVIAHA
jgi:succinate dehydrogenase/fumarate reductase flavoprotein subunit